MKKHFTKRKRGRPVLFDKARLTMTGSVFQSVRTKRGLQNNTYALEVLKIMKNRVEPETFEYFHSEKSTKTSILSELGRLTYSLFQAGLTIEQVEMMIGETAEELYMLHKEHGFKVKALVHVCRDIRLNR